MKKIILDKYNNTVLLITENEKIKCFSCKKQIKNQGHICLEPLLDSDYQCEKCYKQDKFDEAFLVKAQRRNVVCKHIEVSKFTIKVQTKEFFEELQPTKVMQDE